MAINQFQVKTYEVKLARQLTIGVNNHFYAYIVCNGDNGELFVVYFMQPNSPVPDNVYIPDRKISSCYVPYDLFPWFLNILQNEKPIYAYRNSDKPIWNRLFTGKEPVGEEES